MSVLTCPVCAGTMREQERESVTIDVCTQCKGVWLDRGELEKLSAIMSRPAARRDDGASGRPAVDRVADDQPGNRSFFGGRRRNDDDDDDDDDEGPGGLQPRAGRRRGSFMDFFD
jgi:uncharacterized protein